MPLYLEAILLGLGLAFLIGPLLIVLVETSIFHGRRGGYLVALGIWKSDVLVSLLSILFIDRLEFVLNDQIKLILALLGGILLIGLGIASLSRKSRDIHIHNFSNKNGAIGHIAKGFAINTFNPFTFFFWIGINSTYLIGKSLTLTQALLFNGLIIGVIMITDSLKVYLADRISKNLSGDRYKHVSIMIGALLILFGVILVVRTVSS